MSAYYNELDAYAAQWLRNLIEAGHLPPGDVDTRSIVDVQPEDLAGYTQCHFFAGIGGWGLAARLAGWPDDRELWTGSAPCQPFSVAGQGKAQDDDRHLWPHLFRLVSARRPAVLMGEQVAAAVGKNWLDGIAADLESIGYACGSAVVPACAVDAPHRRDRLWFVANASSEGLAQRVGNAGVLREVGGEHQGQDAADDARTRPVAHAAGEARRQAGLQLAGNRPADCSGPRDRTCDAGEVGDSACDVADGGSAACNLADSYGVAGRQGDQDTGGGAHGSGAREVSGLECADHGDVVDTNELGASEERQQRSWELGGTGGNPWARHSWIIGHDGKARRVESSIRLLAHGVPARVGRLRAYGNAIVPALAAEVIGAYLDCYP